MQAKTLMIQGTGSHVGKSFLVTGLCRVFHDRGVSVAPFKSQNMALNSAATDEGLEIGRAQAVQAQACGIKATALMNPILLKPTSERRAQVIVMGRAIADMSAVEYHERKGEMLATIEMSMSSLRSRFELVIIEGAGSPAEINLMDRDIANMAVARLADAPVVLVADIDKGGAFASIVGTLELLAPEDRARIRGFIINKFRGDHALLQPGLDWLQKRTGKPVLGVLPFARIALEAEDSVCLEDRSLKKGASLRLAVPLLPRISNFTDLQPFELLPDVTVDYVAGPAELGQPDAIIIPGTKNTLLDLAWLRANKLGQAFRDLASSGTPIIGICGGYQILGDKISDPLGVEGEAGAEARGLGLLPVETVLTGEKTVKKVTATLIGGERVLGEAALDAPVLAYEIHSGVTTAAGPGRPLTADAAGVDGWAADDVGVIGTYLHGLFDNDRIRSSFLAGLAETKGIAPIVSDGDDFETRVGALADLVRSSVDIEALVELIGIETLKIEGANAR